MRVTFNSDSQNALADLQRARDELLKWQRQVSSGRRIQKPSDDPDGTADAIEARAQLGSVDRYIGATDSVDSRLTIVDTVLTDVVNQLTTAQVTVTGVRGTVAGSAEREAAARELESIKDSLLTDANQMFRGSYLFSGSKATTPPYYRLEDGSISAYQGDSNPISVDIDKNRAVQATFDGAALYKGTDEHDVFATIDNLISAVRAGDQSQMAKGMDDLGSALNRAINVQSGVGLDLGGLDSERTRLTALKQAATARVSANEDANMASAISNMSLANNAYQAALGAIGARSKLSLLDYIR